MPGVIVAGIGARPGCGREEVARLLARAAAMTGCVPEVLAVPWFRADAAWLDQGLRVAVLGREALLAVQPGCPTRSARALRETGIASVAEGCALAGAGADARLVLTRIGSANATCAIAIRGQEP